MPVAARRELDRRRRFFILLLIGLAILFLYPFEWLVSAAFKPRGETFDNAFLPQHWAWNFTGEDHAEPRAAEALQRRAGRALDVEQRLDQRASARRSTTFSSALVAFAFAYFRFPLRNFFFGDPARDDDAAGRGDDDPGLPALEQDRQVHARRTRGCRTSAPNTQYPLWVPNLFGSAFYIFLQRQFFMGIPRDYFEAARMDGDSYFSMFRRIALPLAKPALIVTFIFEIQAKWFDLIDAAHLPARPGALHGAARA